MRNADFSAQANTLVDEFYQVHNDTAGVAAQAPFNSLSGVCSANVAKTAGGTLCYVDATDASTDVRGNITGTNQTTTAYSTANWWVHTGATGTQYVDGTTSGHYLYSIAHGAAAAATVYADKTTYTSDAGYATTTNKSGETGVTGNDGITTLAGQSRTFTATQVLSSSTTSTVVDGYTFKVATHRVDRDGNQLNSTAYYPSSAGTASWTVTCRPDDSTTTATWWESYELTVTMGAADGGTGIPVGGGNPLAATVFGTGVGGNNATLNVTCLDDARVYTGGTTAETLAVSSNNYTISAAGSLASVTATAYDQYGDGVAGASVRISSDTDGGGVVTQANLTTGANGTATLSAVVCATGVETVAWSVVDPTGDTLMMDDITSSTPAASTTEGTTIYCTSAGTDGAVADATTVQAVSTMTYTGKVTADVDGGTATVTVANTQAATSATTDALDLTVGTVTNLAGAATAIQTAVRGLANVDAATTVAGTTAGGSDTFTVTFPANTGTWTVTMTSSLTDGGAAIAATSANDGTAGSTVGVAPQTLDFIDDDATANSIVTAFNITYANAAGAATAQTVLYQTWTYDDTDVLTSTAVPGMTEAQFETANGLIANLTTNMSISYRTGALTTGVSVFQVN